MVIIGSICIGTGVAVLAATLVLWLDHTCKVKPTPRELWLFRKPSRDEFG